MKNVVQTIVATLSGMQISNQKRALHLVKIKILDLQDQLNELHERNRKFGELGIRTRSEMSKVSYFTAYITHTRLSPLQI